MRKIMSAAFMCLTSGSGSASGLIGTLSRISCTNAGFEAGKKGRGLSANVSGNASRITSFLALITLSLQLSIAHCGDAILYSAISGDCELRLESRLEYRTLRMRLSHVSSGNCAISPEAAKTALETVLSGNAPLAAGEQYETLCLGRAVDYPFISQGLAQAALKDKAWDSSKGRPRQGGINNYAAGLLLSPGLLEPISQGLGAGGYRIVKASLEKVLVKRQKVLLDSQARQPEPRVPFDALICLHLVRD